MMKKLVLTIALLTFGFTNAQKETMRSVAKSNKYENIYYQASKYASELDEFQVNGIMYSNGYHESSKESWYLVRIYGKVNGKNESVDHYVESTEALSYYTKLFNGKYKKIVVLEFESGSDSGKTTNTAITVEH